MAWLPGHAGRERLLPPLPVGLTQKSPLYNHTVPTPSLSPATGQASAPTLWPPAGSVSLLQQRMSGRGSCSPTTNTDGGGKTVLSQRVFTVIELFGT